MKKGFKLNVARIHQDFLDIGTKFKPLLRTDFSASESGKFSGIVTTVLRLSIDESRVLEGPVDCSSLWALIWCKWLKICPAILVQSIGGPHQNPGGNSKLFNHLHQIKAHKLEQLTGPSNTRDSSIESIYMYLLFTENSQT